MQAKNGTEVPFWGLFVFFILVLARRHHSLLALLHALFDRMANDKHNYKHNHSENHKSGQHVDDGDREVLQTVYKILPGIDKSIAQPLQIGALNSYYRLILDDFAQVEIDGGHGDLAVITLDLGIIGFNLIAHIGESLSRGHYIGWMRENPNRWVRFDDDRVKMMEDKDIEATNGYLGKNEPIAYILLYRTKARYGQ